jgi:hypothetical protein
MLYMLTRVCGARDWGHGLPLSAHLLGKLNALQVHHIFPKALLYKHGYSQPDVNSIANFCFLTQGTNLDISAKEPVYFKEIEEKYPGALASCCQPTDFYLEMCLGLVETAVNPLLKTRLAELLTKLVTEKSLGGIACGRQKILLLVMLYHGKEGL